MGLQLLCVRCNLPVEEDPNLEIPPKIIEDGRFQLQAAHRTVAACERAIERARFNEPTA